MLSFKKQVLTIILIHYNIITIEQIKLIIVSKNPVRK